MQWMRGAVAVAVAAMTIAAAGGTTAEAMDKLIIAHRGASGYLPEHTLAAKAMAHTQGAHYVEQDVVLTKDGVPVVLHDIYLDTVTNVAELFPGRQRADGRAYVIDFTLAEIKRLRVNERISLKTGKRVFPNRFPPNKASFSVPTLAEEIELIQGLNATTGRTVGIYPEVKKPAFHRAEGQDISRIVLDVLKAYGYADKTGPVYLQCFDWIETQRIRRELGYKGKLTQLITENDGTESPEVDFDWLRTADGLAAVAQVADAIGPWIPHVVSGLGADGTPEITDLVETAHGLGLAVHPYTFRADQLPEGAASLAQVFDVFLVQANVDGVFTDFPDQGVAFLAKQTKP